ncbi:MAG TPA: hypothetical protein VIG72_06785 [Pontibacter sp.]
MKIASQFAVAALFLTLMSCSDSGKTENTTTTAPATRPANQASTPGTAVALNPAHGQPGHRCDIEVGAPLDSPPKPNLTVPATPAPMGTQTVAPGMNPPHGQPGHDCGIPVGAPLNQK